MKLDIIEKNIGEFLSNQKMFNEEQAKLIQKGIDIIFEDFKTLVDGNKEIEQNKNRVTSVISCVLCVSSYVLDAPINKDFSNFVVAFSELVFNWNSNSYKDELLRQIPLFMNRFIEVRNTMTTTTTIIKDVDQRMRDLNSWTPPAYEISIDYFEKLLKENEKE